VVLYFSRCVSNTCLVVLSLKPAITTICRLIICDVTKFSTFSFLFPIFLFASIIVLGFSGMCYGLCEDQKDNRWPVIGDYPDCDFNYDYMQV